MTTYFDFLLTWLKSDRPDLVMHQLYENGWLAEHTPELHRLYGIPQRADHHPEVDTGRHMELALQWIAANTDDPMVRYAVLVHDIGKGLTPRDQWPAHIKHEELGVIPGIALGRRLGVPKEWRLLGALTSRYHLRVHICIRLPARSLVRFFRDAKFFERPQLLEPFLLACEADARGREGLQDREYPQVDRLKKAFAAALEVAPIENPCTYHETRIRHVAKALRAAEASH